MQYSVLTQMLKDFLETDETVFNNNIDYFISLAEEKIFRSVLIPEIRKNSTGTTTASTAYLATPSDFLAPLSLAVDQGGSSGYRFLINKDVNFIREAYPLATSEGVPRFYALFDDDTFILGPTPDDAYTVELHYYYRPAQISSSNTTTWLSTNAENALFYGVLLEAYTFLKGEGDMFNVYNMHYQKAMEDLRKLGEGLDKKDSYRHGEMRTPA